MSLSGLQHQLLKDLQVLLKIYQLSWLLLQTQSVLTLVKDLKKPGGNITGVSDHNPAEQQVELIKTPHTKCQNNRSSLLKQRR